MIQAEQVNLSGKRALVTGSSEGIGKAIALILAEHGAELIVHDKDNELKAKRVSNEIIDKGGKASYLTADLSKQSAAEQIHKLTGPADILVLNASIQIKRAFEVISYEDFEQQVMVNFWSGIRLIQLFSSYMQKESWGRILTIGSVQQVKPHPQMAVYAALKAAMANLVQNLSIQYAADGVTVNNLAPGVIETRRNQAALADDGYAAKVRSSIPAGQFGYPEDCAGLALLLCTDAGRYITGQTIYCDGGMGIR